LRSDNFVNLLLPVIGLLAVFSIILYLCEKRRTSKKGKELLYFEDERDELDKLMESSPRDVYNE